LGRDGTNSHNRGVSDSMNEGKKNHKGFEIVEDVPTTIKRPSGGPDRVSYERSVIELNQMKFKLSAS
jgi:hypothetical protein